MIDAHYYDGQSTRRHPITLIIHKRIVSMRGMGLHRSIRLSQLKISEPLEHAPRILRFPDGALIEVADKKLDKLLAANRYRESRVVRWQRNWPLSLFALITLLGLLISGYQWGVPWAADKIAQHLPTSIERKIGDQELAIMDAHYMAPSKLDPVDKARLQRLFAALKQPRGEKTAYRLEFRDSRRMGPNAFALPNGVIIMTDQLVRLADNDQAVLGVLGHELGHLQHRHSLRHLLQTVGLGVVLNFWVGDVSSALAAMPTFLLDQKYSRDFEREADQYAIDMMHENELPLSPMADLFVKLGNEREAHKKLAGQEPSAEHGSSDEGGEAPPTPQREKERDAMSDYLSSHPSDDERIAKLRAADVR
jgi:Zn-dependent protease with chaperone function